MRHWSLQLLRRITRVHTRQLSQSATMSKRIAVCQMTSVADKLANMEVVSKLIGDAAKENVEMIFFPEACDYIGENKKDIVALAEPIVGGNTVTKYRELAVKHNVWLSMGGVHEKDETNPSKMYNTHLIIDNKGEIVQAYRKLHLFDVEIPEKKVRLKESDFCQPGEHIVTPVQTPVGKIGLGICYDMRFPELSTALSIMGAELLTYPSAFTVPTGLAHWHTLLRSRAIENQCYVVAAAQVGAHNARRSSYGHALCVDPWGVVLADCGDSAPGLLVAEVGARRLREVRTDMPVFQHRRRGVYSLYTLSLRKELLPEHSSTPGNTSRDTDTVSGNNNPDTGNDSSVSETKNSEEETHVFGHVRVPESCVFYKSEKSFAFVNLRCVTPGHVLVASRRAAPRTADLSPQEAGDFFSTVLLVQRLVERVQRAAASTLTIQDGRAAGQTVQHLHCHVMPRKPGDFIENDLIYLELAKHDQFKSGHPGKPPRSLQEMRAEAALLREELSALLREMRPE